MITHFFRNSALAQKQLIQVQRAQFQILSLINKQQQLFSKKQQDEQDKQVQMSYFHGTSNTKLQYITIGEKLRETAELLPDHSALISHHQSMTFTYSQLYQKCEQLAASLLAIGLKKGDRIGIYSPNNYEWCLLQYAASMADVILVNINPAYQENELEYCLNKGKTNVYLQKQIQN